MAIDRKLTKTYTFKQKDEDGKDEVVASIKITEPKGKVYTNIIWDSKTGLVTANENGSKNRIIIPHEGNALVKLKPAPFTAEGVYAIDYNFWYY